jgi:Zn-dependent protease
MDRLVYLLFAMAGLGVAMIFHEQWHARVAVWLGDPGPKNDRRLGWNPVDHFDPFASLLLPIFTAIAWGIPFGGAKPVRVNPLLFRHPLGGNVLVAAAGPLSNFFLAGVTFGLMALLWWLGRPLLFAEDRATYNALFLHGFLLTNILLGAFNLLPLPALDGSRILYYFLPRGGRALLDAIEPFALLVTFVLLRFGAGQVLAPVRALAHLAFDDAFSPEFTDAILRAIYGI